LASIHSLSPPCPPEVRTPCPPRGGELSEFKPPLGGLWVKLTEQGLGVSTIGVKRLILRLLLLFIIVTVLTALSYSQSLNYPEIFGDDWKKAIMFESENRSWMEPILSKNHISYPLAVAVIFPELVRYSALQDKMEITLLKALYINLGDEYANFSIGQFQMKPSFAALVREQTNYLLNRRSGISLKRSSEYDDIKDYRKSIVKDLEDPKSEFNYLVAFIKICDKNFRTNRMDEISGLKFLSTAYNFGINKSSAEIEKMVDKKFFNTKLFKTENYSYADVSLCWYKHYQSANNLNTK
jgi:hypothetical protein